MLLMREVVAVTSALWFSARYRSKLDLRANERFRFFRKATFLGACYAAFAEYDCRKAWQAGRAAFLSSAYDVLTDWRKDKIRGRHIFEAVVRAVAKNDESAALAMVLLVKDSAAALAYDGLERGSMALRAILMEMGCEREREAQWGDLDELGRALQLVDDVLDYDDDVRKDQLNCLRSYRAAMYLDLLGTQLAGGRTWRLFSFSVLNVVIAISRVKAMSLRSRVNRYANVGGRVQDLGSPQPDGSGLAA